ncbi:hypothetical protein M5D96_002976, partial [Drosophila gunungcola]
RFESPPREGRLCLLVLISKRPENCSTADSVAQNLSVSVLHSFSRCTI